MTPGCVARFEMSERAEQRLHDMDRTNAMIKAVGALAAISNSSKNPRLDSARNGLLCCELEALRDAGWSFEFLVTDDGFILKGRRDP